jgi:hypothetical protein
MQLVKDALGWGLVLWLIGYVLGIALFFVMPPTAIGWVIAPVGILITLWVLLRRAAAGGLARYAVLALVWTAIAVVFDYLFIVRAFNPADGYYKPDVYLYYAATFGLPLAVGWWRGSRAMSDAPPLLG